MRMQKNSTSEENELLKCLFKHDIRYGHVQLNNFHDAFVLS
jgi:hypothetical protein